MPRPDTLPSPEALRNVGDAERWFSGIAGGLLVVKGIAERSVGGIAKAFVGGLLVSRGLSGHSPIYAALGISTAGDADGRGTAEPAGPGAGAAGPTGPAEAADSTEPADEPGHDRVVETSEESFPASDSPGWTPGSHVGAPPRRRSGGAAPEPPIRPEHEPEGGSGESAASDSEDGEAPAG